jgi:hypothetical protein
METLPEGFGGHDVGDECCEACLYGYPERCRLCGGLVHNDDFFPNPTPGVVDFTTACERCGCTEEVSYAYDAL